MLGCHSDPKSAFADTGGLTPGGGSVNAKAVGVYRDVYEGSSFFFILLASLGGLWGLGALGVGFVLHAPQPSPSVEGIMSLILLFPVWGAVPLLMISSALGLHGKPCLLEPPLVGTVVALILGHWWWYRFCSYKV